MNPFLLVSLTPLVKRLIVINVFIWFFFVLIYQNFFAEKPYIFHIFGLVPSSFLYDFCFWQPFTYMFLHSSSVFHILFNMLILWWLGSELELLWGRSFFLIYYLVCGVGAAFIYAFGILLYYLITQNSFSLSIPVVGSSGAVFGLILAYGLLFGERIIYFMMFFPMKAKYFVMILATIECFNLLSVGVSSKVANLAHLGGFVSGFLFLWFFTLGKRWKRQKSSLFQKWKNFKRGKRQLKFVSKSKESKGTPTRYWH